MAKGQENLITDLKLLLSEAEAGEFGDFTNNKYDAPKLALIQKGQDLIDNVKAGRYDD